MPQMETLIELLSSLKQFAILIKPFATSSGESWYKLLIQFELTIFLKEKYFFVNHALVIVHVALCCLGLKTLFQICYIGASQR